MSRQMQYSSSYDRRYTKSVVPLSIVKARFGWRNDVRAGIDEVKLGQGQGLKTHADGEGEAPPTAGGRLPRRFLLPTRQLFRLHSTRLDIYTSPLSEHNKNERNTLGHLTVHKRPRDCPRWRFPRSSAFLSQRSARLSHPFQLLLSKLILTESHIVCSRLHLPPLRHRTHLPHPPLQQSHWPLWNPRAFHWLRAEWTPAQPLHILSRDPRTGRMALLCNQTA
jgi:hypothetical protein